MWIFLSVVIFAAVFFGGLMLLRKIQNDYLHNNLLDIVDKHGGKVVRHGFAHIPFYHGEYKGSALVINFTTAKDDKGQREYYATFSYEKELGVNFNLMSLRWLESHKVDENPDVPVITLRGFRVSSSDKRVLNFFKKNEDLLQSLSEKADFVYLFSSVRGIMFEVQIPSFGEGSKAEELLGILEKVDKLVSRMRRELK